MSAGSGRVKFIVAWSLLLLAKVALAASLDLFGDEAFYAWEARHPAWAYSDLPGLTAWLAWLGLAMGGDSALALRAPFLMLGAALPWLVVRIARRWFGEDAGWQAGGWALLLPLAGSLGVLALPDVPLLFASLLAADAVASLQRRIGWPATVQLAVALALGALAHYRFAGVVVAGMAGLLLSQGGRGLLRQPRLWLALAMGAAAWLPLLLWNLGNAGAGLSFQLVDRHPWQFHASGAWWPLVQALVVTPAMFIALLAVLVRAWREWRKGADQAWPWLLGAGGVAALAYLPLAFFADAERLSLHWPLPGWLLLTCALPIVLEGWPRWARQATAALAAAGLAICLSYLAIAAQSNLRESLAESPYYPDNFSGWREVSAAVDAELQSAPGMQVVADNFMLGAQLAFALGLPDRQLSVLEHPLNEKHGRAAQLRLWGLERTTLPGTGGTSTLLVVEDTARPLKDRLRAYHELCRRVGNLPRPQVLQVDRGRKRFLLFRLPAPASSGCITPALAWLDAPRPGDAASATVLVSGWAFKDGVGLARVELTLDGRVVAEADYGAEEPGVDDYWKGSTDPSHPRVGIRAEVPLTGVAPGRHWLGLVLHGRDGSIEPWPAQSIEVTD